MNVIQFNRSGPRAPHPIAAILSGLSGIRPRDFVDQLSPSTARLNIDVSDVGDKAIRVDRDSSQLTVKAKGWGTEELLRRIAFGSSVRPTRHRRRGDILEIDLDVIADRDPPPPVPGAIQVAA